MSCAPLVFHSIHKNMHLTIVVEVGLIHIYINIQCSRMDINRKCVLILFFLSSLGGLVHGVAALSIYRPEFESWGGAYLILKIRINVN